MAPRAERAGGPFSAPQAKKFLSPPTSFSNDFLRIFVPIGPRPATCDRLASALLAHSSAGGLGLSASCWCCRFARCCARASSTAAVHWTRARATACCSDACTMWRHDVSAALHALHGCVLCGSTAARRAAAAYADGPRWLVAPRTLDSLMV